MRKHLATWFVVCLITILLTDCGGNAPTPTPNILATSSPTSALPTATPAITLATAPSPATAATPMPTPLPASTPTALATSTATSTTTPIPTDAPTSSPTPLPTPTPIHVPVIQPTPTPTPTRAPTAAPLTEEYVNAVYGISIKYPQDWVKQEGVTGTVVGFVHPKRIAGLTIGVEDLSKSPMTLNEYTVLGISLLKPLISEFKMIESSSTTLAGNPAQRLVYLGKQGPYSLKYMQILAIKNSRAYIISFFAIFDEYQDFLGIIQQMIDSFIIATPPPAPTPTRAPSAAPLTEEYVNAVYGISIKYPQDWVKQEGFAGTVVLFLSPKEGASDIFQENLIIIAIDDVAVLDLSEAQMKLTELIINQLKQSISEFKMIESSSTYLAGNPAQRLVYLGKQGQNSFKWMQVFAIKNSRYYLITYTAEFDKYQDFLGIIQQMIDSFIIATPPPTPTPTLAPTPAPTPTVTPAPTPVPTVGTRLVIGNIAVTLNSVGDYKETDSYYLRGLSSGQKFIIIDLTIENGTKNKMRFSDSDAKVQSEQGFLYTKANSSATKGLATYGDLNPGEKTRLLVSFEVPQDAKIVKVTYKNPTYDQNDFVFILR